MTESNPSIIEQWKPVVGLEDTYEVSDHGQVRNIGVRQVGYTGKILKQKIDKYGYPAVTLKRLGIKTYPTIHRLVALAFIGPRPAGYHVNHKDGNKLNNDVENLEYLTVRDNVLHAVRIGLHPSGDRHWTRRHPEWQKRRNGKWAK